MQFWQLLIWMILQDRRSQDNVTIVIADLGYVAFYTSAPKFWI